MGLLYANRIVERFQRGLYRRRPTRFVVSVDGELMRYKGMVAPNLTRHDAEEAVAHTSYTYLVRTVTLIEAYLGRKASRVDVYMDGARVANKTTARPDCGLDVGLVRSTFTRLCAENGYTVVKLERGESELQMYLQRDRATDLNVLLTNDSDMIPICYGHLPTCYGSDGRPLTGAEVPDRWATADAGQPEAAESLGLVDLNRTYRDGVDVRDSCLWIVCGSSTQPMQAIGFDGCAHRTGYNDKVFRTFTAVCGTDFTDALLTPGMFTGFFCAADGGEKALMNSLTDAVSVVAGVLYLGLKGGGSLKRYGSSGGGNTDFTDLATMVAVYYAYISTGVMEAVRIRHVAAGQTVRRLVDAMMRGGAAAAHSGDDEAAARFFSKKELVKWANTVPLAECLHNLDTYREKVGVSEEKEKRPCAEEDRAIDDHFMAGSFHYASHLGFADRVRSKRQGSRGGDRNHTPGDRSTPLSTVYEAVQQDDAAPLQPTAAAARITYFDGGEFSSDDSDGSLLPP